VRKSVFPGTFSTVSLGVEKGDDENEKVARIGIQGSFHKEGGGISSYGGGTYRDDDWAGCG